MYISHLPAIQNPIRFLFISTDLSIVADYFFKMREANCFSSSFGLRGYQPHQALINPSSISTKFPIIPLPPLSLAPYLRYNLPRHICPNHGAETIYHALQSQNS